MDCFLDKDDIIEDFPSFDETALISGMILGSILLILIAIILVMSLYPVLQREIGLKRLKALAPFSFGIKAGNEELVLPPILLVS